MGIPIFQIFSNTNTIKGSNHFIDMSVLYRKKKFQLFILQTFLFYINIVVERVPYCVWTSNSLALTMLMVPHYWFGLVDRESK